MGKTGHDQQFRDNNLVKQMRLIKKWSFLFVLVSGLIGCGQGELKRLQEENAAVKARVESLENQIESLEKENFRLKETDQNYFQRAIAAHESAISDQSRPKLEASIDAFDTLITKFPSSNLIGKAKEYLRKDRKRLGVVKKIEMARAQFEDALSKRRFSNANAAIAKMRGLVPPDEVKQYKKRVYEERNKPVVTTINKLVSDWGTISRGYSLGAMKKILDKRVQVDVYFGSIDRGRKMISARNGWSEGSRMEVSYGGSNLEDEFTRSDPRGQDQYRIVGRIKKYSNSFTLYIKAERIQKL